MKPIVDRCLAGLLALLAGCAHHPEQVWSPFSRQQIFTNSSGEQSCALHRTPLVTTSGFALSFHTSGVIPDPDYVSIGTWYPNHVALGKSLTRSEDYDEPTRLTYCPQCQAEYERASELYRASGGRRSE